MAVRVELRRDAGKWAGSLWVRRKDVARVLGPPDPLAIATLVDHRDRVLGHGLYSPESSILVRLLRLGEAPPSPAWLERRLERAFAARAVLGLGVGAGQCTGYREVNTEGDGLPGLVIDRYGDWRVVQLTTAPMLARRAAIGAWLAEHAPLPGGLMWLAPERAGAQEGFEAIFEVEGGGEGPTHLCWREGESTLSAPPPPSQKTGAYHDQRENRARFAERVAGRASEGPLRVLDLGCHVGGFALALARRGCEVVAVDQSRRALDFVERNAALNELSSQVELVQADMFGALDDPALAGPFHAIVFDPPKIASSRRDLGRAIGALRRSVSTLLPRLVEGGLLALCSCSHHLGSAELDRALREAAESSGLPCTRAATWGPGPDHPSWPGHEGGDYLRVHLYQRR